MTFKPNKSSKVEDLLQANVVAHVDSEVEKERKGLEYGGEFLLTCSNCDKKLAIIMRVREDDIETRFRAECPCGDHSFVTPVGGQVRIAAAEGMNLIDIQMEDNMTMIVVK